MMRLFINAISATAGGGITYIRNVVPQLAATPGITTALLAPASLYKLLGQLPNTEYLDGRQFAAGIGRFWSEQTKLSKLIAHTGADVLISAGNFALRRSPVPQILLSRNSLYTSSEFFRDLVHRRKYLMWADNKLRAQVAKASLRWADATVAPSQAFADELTRCTGRPVRVINHGFDAARFLHSSPLPGFIQQQLATAHDSFKLLFVSHYNYYRNFETLFRGLHRLRTRALPRRVKLILTCKLESGQNPGSYDASLAAAMVQKLGIADDVLQLGTVSYESLAHLYRACDLYVSAAYAETFAHPLVEAMSCGLPIVASDLPVHREICGRAAVYFSTFSGQKLADCIFRLMEAPQTRREMSRAGIKRSGEFSWGTHVCELLGLAAELTAKAGATTSARFGN